MTNIFTHLNNDPVVKDFMFLKHGNIIHDNMKVMLFWAPQPKKCNGIIIVGSAGPNDF
jgi:hypothetical protein